jgi:hypothetical protein
LIQKIMSSLNLLSFCRYTTNNTVYYLYQTRNTN